MMRFEAVGSKGDGGRRQANVACCVRPATTVLYLACATSGGRALLLRHDPLLRC